MSSHRAADLAKLIDDKSKGSDKVASVQVCVVFQRIKRTAAAPRQHRRAETKF